MKTHHNFMLLLEWNNCHCHFAVIVISNSNANIGSEMGKNEFSELQEIQVRVIAVKLCDNPFKMGFS